jgi:sialate O-acetylesterase
MTRFRQSPEGCVIQFLTAARRAALSAAMVFVLAASTPADVTLPAIIGDHMVLQSGTPLTIWGWAEPGEEVSVSLAEMNAVATADPAGEWLLKLPPMAASAEPLIMTISGRNTIELTDVLVGEVWLGSGQSNMEWPVIAADDAPREIAAANDPQLRLFLVPKTPAATPAKNVEASWTVCTPDSVKSFSAVSYFFGRELREKLDVPVGMIASAWGGTRIEPWTPPAAFADSPDLENERKQLEAARAGYAHYKDELKRHLPKLRAWLEDAEKAVANGELPPDPPAFPPNPFGHPGAPTSLYNGMIHPLVPFALRGALWYQGEANRGQGLHYHDLMQALIRGWRTEWRQGNFPFLFVQLAPYRYDEHVTWLPEIWEAQTATLTTTNTGMAVTTDIGNVADIHPRNKREVGRRLALWALAKTYGHDDLVYSGPMYESMTVEGGRARVKFRHVGGGLTSRDERPLTWFSIAGEDKKFVPATATIEGDAVVVESPSVSAPVAVRFGWHQVAEPNLANQEGLPASPFRTDNWPDAINAEQP